jgi:hypothetical protein
VPKVKAPIPIGDRAALLARRPDVRETEQALARYSGVCCRKDGDDAGGMVM